MEPLVRLGTGSARTCFGEELSLGFKPIGTRVAQERESVAAF